MIDRKGLNGGGSGGGGASSPTRRSRVRPAQQSALTSAATAAPAPAPALSSSLAPLPPHPLFRSRSRSRHSYSYSYSRSPPPQRSSSRPRLSSKDIPRTYSGLYGQGGPDSTDPSGNVTSDLLPFELSRNRNTDWIDTGAPILLATYVGVIVASEAALCAVVPFRKSWTVVNVTHGLITYVYLHWIKGSPNFYEQGEMNAMTFWEQLSSSPEKERHNQRTALVVVPTVLCHAACHFGRYDKLTCALNVAVWIWCVVAKMDCMSGVRVWGINSTTGIDDDARKSR